MRSRLDVKAWLTTFPSAGLVRPERCPSCGVASRLGKRSLRLHGHGLRQRQMVGPPEPLSDPTVLDVLCRRYLCLVCEAVVLVVPGSMLPRHRYSASAIAQALALYGIEKRSLVEVRRRTSPDKVLGFAAAAGWGTVRRWCDDIRTGRLFPGLPLCPELFTRRQVAELAAGIMISRAPPPCHPSLMGCAFVGAARSL